MPHCLIEGSQSLTRLITPAELLRLVEEATAATGLFQPGEVKLRLSLYEHFNVGGTQEDFVHLIFYILAGRTDERLPGVNALSLDVRDIDREVFSNRRSCLTAQLSSGANRSTSRCPG